MFKFLKSLFLNKNYLQKTTEDIIFDIAQINDIEKIKDFIFCGAREGHFKYKLPPTPQTNLKK